MWRFLRSQFYDRNMHGVDWEEARRRHEPKLAAARTQEDVYAVIRDLLAELRVSHLQIIPRETYLNRYDAEGKGGLPPRYGMRLAQLDEGYFVVAVTPGTPAAAAGVKRGDRLLSVGGEPPSQTTLELAPYDPGIVTVKEFYVPTDEEGQQVELELERTPTPLGRYEVTLVSRPWNDLNSCRLSREIHERWGFKVGYIHLYHLLQKDVTAYLVEFLCDELRDADAVVVDLRGIGGLPALVDEVIEIFDPRGQNAEIFSPKLARGREHRPAPLWDKCAVALIDDHTRSAKELVAWEWRARRIGPLVGTTTAGALLAATWHDLDDGSVLLYPFMDMRSSTGGVQVEGRGVAPHVVVEQTIPYAQGDDQIKRRGIEVAFEELLRIQQARSKRAAWR